MSEQTDNLVEALRGLQAPADVLEQLETVIGDLEASREDTAAALARNQAILDATVDAIVTIDENGIIESVNPATERLFGYAAEAMIGRNVTMLMPDSYRDTHDGYIRRYLETREPRIIGTGREVEGRRRNGEIFPLYLAVSQVDLPGTIRFTGILRDISKRVRAEQALTLERNFISAVIDTAWALVIVLDPYGKIVRFNRACETTTGYTEEEVRGRQFWDLFLRDQDKEPVRKGFGRVARGHFPSQGLNVWMTRDGESRMIEWVNTCLVDELGEVTHVIATGIDVTEQKAAERALVEISEGVRKLVGQELHDALGQQLTGITLLSKTLENRLRGAQSPFADDARELTDLSRGAVSEARRLAQGLYPAELERHGLKTALAELTSSIRRLGTVSCEYEDRSEDAEADQSTSLHLYRIAQEATTNAVKHGQASSIRVKLTRIDDHLELVVSDDGIGFEYDTVTERGLGLSILNYRAKFMGADLSIRSRPGEGTTVRCRAPATFDQTTGIAHA